MEMAQVTLAHLFPAQSSYAVPEMASDSRLQADSVFVSLSRAFSYSLMTISAISTEMVLVMFSQGILTVPIGDGMCFMGLLR